MTGDTGSSAARELLLVVAVAAAGVLLALAAVFAPWHAVPDGAAPAGLVELHLPGSGSATTEG
ncbi:hypothetical protein [Micromonospora sp. NPDC126480]|uniref:hypothetical protein n=1 Tax=Micromonospora sp. NPDC126480 TaxID=3155312 RepID=UPI00331F833C